MRVKRGSERLPRGGRNVEKKRGAREYAETRDAEEVVWGKDIIIHITEDGR